jgi:tRNA A37 methylthiotransferase MiaB
MTPERLAEIENEFVGRRRNSYVDEVVTELYEALRAAYRELDNLATSNLAAQHRAAVRNKELRAALEELLGMVGPCSDIEKARGFCSHPHQLERFPCPAADARKLLERLQ